MTDSILWELILITNYAFVTILFLWQLINIFCVNLYLIYVYCSNFFNNIKFKFTYKLLLVQNIFKIYASEILFCSSHHVKYNGAIGIQNGDHTKKIKYFLWVNCMLKKLHQYAIYGWKIELARSEKIRDVEGVAAVRTERSRVEGHAWWKGSRAPRDQSRVNGSI